LNEAKKGAHNADQMKNFTNGFADVKEVYGDCFDNVAMVTLAPEKEGSEDVIKELCARGVKVSLGKIQLYFFCCFFVRWNKWFQNYIYK